MWAAQRRINRWFCTAIHDEGHWRYSKEWWGTIASGGRTVFRSASTKGNGVVSVVSHPSSKPSEEEWQETEKWLERRYREEVGGQGGNGGEGFRVLGYEWRTLRFNDETRQSTVKVMAACPQSEPSSVFLMQQPHCLAVPYVKSMVSLGLASVASCGYDLLQATRGNQPMRILCIGHGGGSLPLFLAKKIPGAIIDIVEIDPLVIHISLHEMGFPAVPVLASSGKCIFPENSIINKMLWSDIKERICLYECDAEKFVLDSSSLYDLIFVDAYDGDDIFPCKLWDRDSPFLNALSDRLHPEHGTVVVNLHSDSDAWSPDPFHTHASESSYIGKIGRAYKDLLAGNGSFRSCFGLGYFVDVPWLCNTTLVVCKGFRTDSMHLSQASVLKTLASKSPVIDILLNLPFSCSEYINRHLTLIY
ncbi:hypothetical protein Tsubulata_023238 [Turnera subulata]|uniref:PABS domain-containing protein n=1 Tax=Turnera subulata TaxID=218843 RepID=A0A9Q0FXU6_9ROSI|nr:hypothetical protein Tsubulata_023238 [Turnera subulata]